MSVSFYIFVVLTTFMVGGVQCRHGEEPSCSVFDYNEKILSKLVRMEHEMELNQKRLESWEEKIERRMSELDDAEKTRVSDANELRVKVLNDFAKETDKLDQAMTSFQRQQGRISEDFANQEVTLNTTLENYLAELRKEETKPADVLSIPTVAFKARNVATRTPTDGSKIVYTEVVLNNGDGYNSATGDFTAQHGGLYFFTVQICSYATSWVRAHIVAADKVIGTVSYYEDSTGYTCTSGNGMAVLTAGDVVWVKCTTRTGSGMVQNSDIWNSFSGMLVHN